MIPHTHITKIHYFLQNIIINKIDIIRYHLWWNFTSVKITMDMNPFLSKLCIRLQKIRNYQFLENAGWCLGDVKSGDQYGRMVGTALLNKDFVMMMMMMINIVSSLFKIFSLQYFLFFLSRFYMILMRSISAMNSSKNKASFFFLQILSHLKDTVLTELF